MLDWPLIMLCLLALVLIALYRSAPKCPRCGSLNTSRDRLLPWVLTCHSCREVFELK